MRKALMTALVALGLCAAGLPPVFGFVAEQRAREAVKDLDPNLPFSVAIEEYERGLYSSTAVLSTRLNDWYLDTLFAEAAAAEEAAAGGEPDPELAEFMELQREVLAQLESELQFDIEVFHGPVGFGGAPFIGLTQSVVRLDAGNGKLRELQDKLQLPYLLEIHADAGLTGATEITGDVPAFNFAGDLGNLNYSGMQISGSYVPTSRQFTLEQRSESLEFATEEGSAVFRELSLSSDGALIDTWISTGNAAISISEMVFAAPDEIPVTVADAAVATQVGLDSTESALDIRLSYRIGAVSGLGGSALRDAELNIGVSGVPVSFFEQYMNMIRASGDDIATPEFQEEMTELGYDMLRASPSFTLEPLRFTLDDESVAVNVRMDVDGTRVPAREQLEADPATAIAMLAITGDLSVSEQLAQVYAETMLRQQLLEGLTPDSDVTAAQIDAAARQQSAAMLSGALQQGIVTRENGVLDSRFEFRDGVLTVNDTPVPLGGP